MGLVSIRPTHSSVPPKVRVYTTQLLRSTDYTVLVGVLDLTINLFMERRLYPTARTPISEANF